MKHLNGLRLPTVTAQAICGFFGDYRFLSNYHLSPVMFNGVKYDSVEHAYVAGKTLSESQREAVRLQPSPAKARELGKQVSIRSDWEYIRLAHMLSCLQSKFADPILVQKLLATNALRLEGTNDWNDKYWGVCDETGHNFLGKLLMLVREDLTARPNTPSVQSSLF